MGSVEIEKQIVEIEQLRAEMAKRNDWFANRCIVVMGWCVSTLKWIKERYKSENGAK